MTVIDDFRYASRVLLRRSLFSAIVIATLTLGIAVNAAVFSILNTVLLRPLPYSHADRLVSVRYGSTTTPSRDSAVPSAPFLAWKNASGDFDGLTAFSLGEVGLVFPNGEPLRLATAFIGYDFFSVLGSTGTERGRGFVPSDAAPGAPSVAIVSHRFWQGRLGGTDAIGKILRLNATNYSIIGITSDRFQFPDAVTPDVFLPLSLPVASPVVRFVHVIGRLKPGIVPVRAEAELLQITRHAEGTFPPAMIPLIASGGKPEVVPLQRQLAGTLRPVLLIAWAVAGCVLLIACANVATLLLARTASREREFAVRRSLGATPLRIGRLILSETLVLGLAGGAASLITLKWSMAFIRRLLVSAAPHADRIGVDGRVLLVLAVSVFVTAGLCAAVPILDIILRDRAAGRRLSAGVLRRLVERDSTRRLLVIGQVAVAFVLLIGALLLLDTLWHLNHVELGFNPAQVLTMRVPALGLGDPTARVDDMIRRIRDLPGVTSAGATSALPLDGHSFRFTVPVEGQAPPPVEAQDRTAVDVISPGYLKTMSVRLLSGRDFDDRDTSISEPVAIVNDAFVRCCIEERIAIGRRIGLGGRPDEARVRVVGVIDDVKDGNPGDDPQPIVYRPFTQAAPQIGWPTANFVVRTNSSSLGMAGLVRQQIAMASPRAAIYDVSTMEDRFARTLAPQRQRAGLFSLLGIVALLLSASGLYGLLAHGVAQDMKEFGVRIALGASRAHLMRLVLSRGLWPTVVGLAIGAASGLFLTRVVAGMLFGVKQADPGVFALGALIMLAISALASYLPARRAMGADPLQALKSE